ncbi:MAG: hypothetical protein J6U98_03315 [Abditibacteriota bacterium]|nr:hypothetical protein [Abditibacteriota bacterium]
MRKLFLILILVCSALPVLAGVRDIVGVVRTFGDTKSRMTCAMVVGDGGYAVAPYTAVAENVSETLDNIVTNPIFISSFTGKAYRAEVVAYDKGLGVALIKLPVKGLPSAPLAPLSVYNKAMYGSYGELTQEQYVGNKWGAECVALTTAEIDGVRQYALGDWLTSNIFVTDIDKYVFAFLSGITPAKAVPNGAVVHRDGSVIGMYLDKLTFTGGRRNYTYGRVAMSHEITKFLVKNGLSGDVLANPPDATASGMTGGGDAFPMRLSMYTLSGRGDDLEALKIADALIADGGSDALTLIVKGDGELAKGNADKALESYAAAKKADDTDPAAYIGTAKAYAAAKKDKEAEAELKAGMEKFPNSAEMAGELTNYYYEKEDFDSALTYAKRAAEISPNSLVRRLVLAKVYKSRDDYQTAINIIGEAIRISPDWTDGIYFLASTFEEGGDMTNAEKGYRLLIQRAPNTPTYLLLWASFLADTGRAAEAVKVLEKVKTLSPTGSAAEELKSLEKRLTKGENDE